MTTPAGQEVGRDPWRHPHPNRAVKEQVQHWYGVFWLAADLQATLE